MRRIDTTLYLSPTAPAGTRTNSCAGWSWPHHEAAPPSCSAGRKTGRRGVYGAGGKSTYAERQKYQVLIIDDRVDVALAVDAEGVHVGRPAGVRLLLPLMGEDEIVGATTKQWPRHRRLTNRGQIIWEGPKYLSHHHHGKKMVLTSPDFPAGHLSSCAHSVNAISGLNMEILMCYRGIPIAGICVVSLS